MPPAMERSVSIRFVKRAVAVLGLCASVSCFAQEVASEPFDVVPSLLNKAREYVGVPYRFGGASPRGFDCSGFVRFVFNGFGIELNRSSRSQATQGEKVQPAEVQPGDLLFFRYGGNRIGHVGIYLGGGEFIHAGSRGDPKTRGVRIARLDSSFYAKRLAAVRRLLTGGDAATGAPEKTPVPAVAANPSRLEVGPSR